MSKIAERVNEILVEKLVLDETPKETDNLFNDLGVDSLDAVELIMMTEDEFDIGITDIEAEQATTFKLLVDLVERKLNKWQTNLKLRMRCKLSIRNQSKAFQIPQFLRMIPQL